MTAYEKTSRPIVYHVYAVLAGMCPQAPAKGALKGGAVIFLQLEIYKNSVSSVEAWMSMEGQIMCIKNAHFGCYQQHF